MPTNRPRVVIVGAGFAGIHAACALAGASVDVIIIDRTNHHLFQPLLYQVATALLSPSDISVPIRYLFRQQKNVSVVLGEVVAIDLASRTVSLKASSVERPSEEPGVESLSYDFLLIAAGARHAYFGHEEWEENAPGLKGLDDALSIRRKFLTSFEQAERLAIEVTHAARVTDPVELKQKISALLTTVIIGGGPTGCELAGIMPETARYALGPDFRHIDPTALRVILIEGGPRILQAFSEKLSARARVDLEKFGVEILTGDPVVDVRGDGVTLRSGKIIPTHNVVWAAGNAASPLARQLHLPIDKAGRVYVEKNLSLAGHPEVFVAGDLANYSGADGQPLPALAQVALQGGTLVGKNIGRILRQEPTEPFVYKDKGNLAIMGRKSAIAQIGGFEFGGFFAFLIWIFVHILFLIGFRNKLSVLLEWGYAYLTQQRGVRLIYGLESAPQLTQINVNQSNLDRTPPLKELKLI